MPVANERAHWQDAQPIRVETGDITGDCLNWDSLPKRVRAITIAERRPYERLWLFALSLGSRPAERS